MSDADKVRENRLRRMAVRQGFILKKSRRRDERSIDYGSYWIVDPDLNLNVAGDRFGFSLKQVEEWLTTDQPNRMANDLDRQRQEDRELSDAEPENDLTGDLERDLVSGDRATS